LLVVGIIMFLSTIIALKFFIGDITLSLVPMMICASS
jgi:hypothetical protein